MNSRNALPEPHKVTLEVSDKSVDALMIHGARSALRVAERKARPAQHLDQSSQTTARTDRSGGSAGQQECPRYLGPLGSRRRLPHTGRGVARPGENTCRRLRRLSLTLMANRSNRRLPNLR